MNFPSIFNMTSAVLFCNSDCNFVNCVDKLFKW